MEIFLYGSIHVWRVDAFLTTFSFVYDEMIGVVFIFLSIMYGKTGNTEFMMARSCMAIRLVLAWYIGSVYEWRDVGAFFIIIPLMYIQVGWFYLCLTVPIMYDKTTGAFFIPNLFCCTCPSRSVLSLHIGSSHLHPRLIHYSYCGSVHVWQNGWRCPYTLSIHVYLSRLVLVLWIGSSNLYTRRLVLSSYLTFSSIYIRAK